MPRTRKLKITDGGPPVAGRTEPLFVAAISPDEAGWKGTLLHMSKERLGQKITLCLPPSAPHDGAVADLFRACGLDVRPGCEIDPNEVIGRVVNATFYRLPDGKTGIIGFETLVQENRDVATAESA